MESLKDAGGRVQECLARAALCDLRAEAVRDPTARATFAESAQCWRDGVVLARPRTTIGVTGLCGLVD